MVLISSPWKIIYIMCHHPSDVHDPLILYICPYTPHGDLMLMSVPFLALIHVCRWILTGPPYVVRDDDHSLITVSSKLKQSYLNLWLNCFEYFHTRAKYFWFALPCRALDSVMIWAFQPLLAPSACFILELVAIARVYEFFYVIASTSIIP